MRSLLAIAVIMTIAATSQARGRRWQTTHVAHPTTQFAPIVGVAPQSLGVTPPQVGVNDALDEVNAERAKRGLRPFLRDDGLVRGAMACAAHRAANRIEFHTSNDFAFGGGARATGCAAWPQGMGWGSCCTFESYTYAGAAWAIGADGRRYMSLFCR